MRVVSNFLFFFLAADEETLCTNFLGKTTYKNGTNIYGPFLGWFFALLTTPTTVVAIFLACALHRHSRAADAGYSRSYQSLSFAVG